MNPWLSIGLVLLASRAMLAFTHLCQRQSGWGPEFARKMLHAGMGLILAACPWLFTDRWAVWVLCAVFAGLLVARRYSPLMRRHLSQIVYGVERRSHGEFYFPLSVALLFSLSAGRPEAHVVLFCAPVLTLALADSAAALVGRTYGRHAYRAPGGTKTLEGSVAFAAVTFFVTHVTLLLGSDVPRGSTLWVALAVAVCLTPVEAVAARGMDNLLVPLASFALLSGLTAAGAGHVAIAACAGAALGVGAAVTIKVLSRRRPSIAR